LRQQTQVRAHKHWNAAYPTHYGAKLSVWLRNGQCLEASLSDAPGDPENPLSSTEILKKNRAVMRSANCASESITQLMKACAELPQAASMASLWRALNKLQKV
jgi:2-methylcitrate dehydratase PrpD